MRILIVEDEVCFLDEAIGFGVDGDNDTVVVYDNNSLPIDLIDDLIDISEV